jgi:hypothetical protein
MTTTDPKDPRLGYGIDKEAIPQNDVYLVLSPEERAKGFVRPFRDSYVHVGRLFELDEDSVIEKLTPSEAIRFGTDKNYVAFLRYPESKHPVIGRALTQEEVDKVGQYVGGCGSVTRMCAAIAETYARNPKFYGATYCYNCRKHLDVSEFLWVNTNEIVGS